MLSMLKNILFLSKKSNQYLNRKHLSERNILTILPNLRFAWNWTFSSSIEHICKYIFTAFRNFILQVSWVEELCLIGAFIHSKVMLGRRRWHPTPVLLPGKPHGWRSLVSCNPWGREESDTSERLHFHFWLSWIGEGNGNPLQCSCLENPRDGGAWWAAVYGVTQSRTRLKRFSSSSSKVMLEASSNFRKMTLNNEQLRHFLAVDQWYSKPTNIETLG